MRFSIKFNLCVIFKSLIVSSFSLIIRIIVVAQKIYELNTLFKIMHTNKINKNILIISWILSI